jgi:hypothetical protein
MSKKANFEILDVIFIKFNRQNGKITAQTSFPIFKTHMQQAYAVNVGSHKITLTDVLDSSKSCVLSFFLYLPKEGKPPNYEVQNIHFL